MAINYIEKGAGLHRAVVAAGHLLECRDGVWVSSNDAAVQAIINSYNPLSDFKVDKIAAIKAEGLRRAQLVFPALEQFDELRLLRELLLSIRATSLQVTADIARARDIYVVGSNAISTVNAFTTLAQVTAYNPVTGPGWPP